MSSLGHLFALSTLLLVFIVTFGTLTDATCEPIGHCSCRRGVDRYNCPLCLCPPCNLCCKYGKFDKMVYFWEVNAWCPNDCRVPGTGIVIDPYREVCPFGYS